jgi:hypothetical protein
MVQARLTKNVMNFASKYDSMATRVSTVGLQPSLLTDSRKIFIYKVKFLPAAR